jgi:hypothetical protein
MGTFLVCGEEKEKKKRKNWTFPKYRKGQFPSKNNDIAYMKNTPHVPLRQITEE